jgi:hypothetical protein
MAPSRGMASGGEETSVTRDMSGDPASVCGAIGTEGLAHRSNSVSVLTANSEIQPDQQPCEVCCRPWGV